MFLCSVDIWDGLGLRMLLKDATIESGLTNEWDVVKRSMTRFTKPKQWLGDEGKRVAEPTQRSKVGPEDHRSRIQEPTVKRGLDSSMMEQILKGMDPI
jgi:hypothetical protein